MRTLHTFGCSFTEEFKEFMTVPHDMTNARVQYVVNHFNGTVPDGWPTMLSNKLDYNLINYAGVNTNEGNCNESILNDVCNNLNNFNKGDMVIIEWTFKERFKYVDRTTHRMKTVLPNSFKEDEGTLENVLYNRNHILWIKELFTKQKIINKVCELIGVDLYYWTIDKDIVNYKVQDKTNNGNYLLMDSLNIESNYIYLITSHGGQTIIDETNGKILDYHFGVSGHKVICDLFYDDIVKDIK
jgi:hypothetical protein